MTQSTPTRRRVLGKDAKKIRNELYARGKRFPTPAEKLSAYQKMVALESWYSWHRHLSWCSGKERPSRRACQESERRCVYIVSESPSAVAAAQAMAAQADFQRAMAYAASRPWWYFYYPGLTLLEMNRWAGEAGVSVGTMSEAIHQLALRAGFL